MYGIEPVGLLDVIADYPGSIASAMSGFAIM
jgi:hypothetical protein